MTSNESAASVFMVMVTGTIETARFPESDALYCKYSWVHGTDWKFMSGLEHGMTQIARKSRDERQQIAWNFPVSATFKSTNPHGWPQLVLSVYGLSTIAGRGEVVRGYGSMHVPISPGLSVQTVDMFVPQASTRLRQVLSWVMGQCPEFVDSKFVAQGKGREGTCLSSLSLSFFLYFFLFSA